MIAENIFNSLFQILGSVMSMGILYLIFKDVYLELKNIKKK
tara:strand:- start:272 stop:394 length:123 start_codon:yes stop_codon:yes gene_type:complete